MLDMPDRLYFYFIFHSSSFPNFPQHKQRRLPMFFHLLLLNSVLLPFSLWYWPIFYTSYRLEGGLRTWRKQQRRCCNIVRHRRRVNHIFTVSIIRLRFKTLKPLTESWASFRLLHLLHYLFFISLPVVDHRSNRVKEGQIFDLLFMSDPLFDWLVLLTPRATLNKNRWWRQPPWLSFSKEPKASGLTPLFFFKTFPSFFPLTFFLSFFSLSIHLTLSTS